MLLSSLKIHDRLCQLSICCRAYGLTQQIRACLLLVCRRLAGKAALGEMRLRGLMMLLLRLLKLIVVMRMLGVSDGGRSVFLLQLLKGHPLVVEQMHARSIQMT